MERLTWATPVGRGLLVAAALSATLWAYACGDGVTEPPTPPPDPPRPATVMVTPATAQLGALGATLQLTAEVRDQNGQAMAGAAVTWASGSAAVATVSGSGLVTAADNGTATITATAGSASGTATVTVTVDQSTNPDRAALVALYNATEGPNWVNNDNWLSDAPMEDWYGVVTGSDGHVTRLSLWENNLTGPIPPELGNLTLLTELELAKNDLSGPIPPELGNLTSLWWLNLRSNDLSGPIPPELANLSNPGMAILLPGGVCVPDDLLAWAVAGAGRRCNGCRRIQQPRLGYRDAIEVHGDLVAASRSAGAAAILHAQIVPGPNGPSDADAGQASPDQVSQKAARSGGQLDLVFLDLVDVEAGRQPPPLELAEGLDNDGLELDRPLGDLGVDAQVLSPLHEHALGVLTVGDVLEHQNTPTTPRGKAPGHALGYVTALQERLYRPTPATIFTASDRVDAAPIMDRA